MGKLHFPITVGIGAWQGMRTSSYLHTVGNTHPWLDGLGWPQNGVEKKKKEQPVASRPHHFDRNVVKLEQTDPILTPVSNTRGIWCGRWQVGIGNKENDHTESV